MIEDIGNKGFCERFSSGKICVSNPVGDVKVWIGWVKFLGFVGGMRARRLSWKG